MHEIKKKLIDLKEKHLQSCAKINGKTTNFRKVAFLMYTEMVNFRSQSRKAASKLKPHRGLGTRLPS